MREKLRPTEQMVQILKNTASNNRSEALEAQRFLAKALELPLRQGILSGDITNDIFETIQIAPGASTEFPLDFVAPGTESQFVAYTIPNHGYIAQKHVEGDYIIVPTYSIAAAIDWLLRYARDARWDIVGRAMEVMESQFVKKINDDAWHTLLSAAVDRNILVFDSDAGNGQFTKRLISLMKVIMRRNGGGNSASNNRSKLTDLYMSPEADEDIRNWGVDQIDETTRRQIFQRDNDTLNRIFGVNLHDFDEFGEGQEYQSFFTNDLTGTMGANDLEVVVGLDQSRRTSFVMPVREDVEIFEDDNLHREKRAGFYGWAEIGMASLDNRSVLAGSM